MARLIVVSNRIDLPVDDREAATGGLAVALAAALRKYEGIWFGWSGRVAERYTGQMSSQQISGVTVATVDLE
jgi:trehalose 6-phosphate synthase